MENKKLTIEDIDKFVENKRQFHGLESEVTGYISKKIEAISCLKKLNEIKELTGEIIKEEKIKNGIIYSFKYKDVEFFYISYKGRRIK